jgi:ArsR family transcriptional regulator, virulence genes transcriptional regulator
MTLIRIPTSSPDSAMPTSRLKPVEFDPEPSDELENMAEKAKKASDFLKALAHENRLLILCMLAEGEKSVTEIERTLEVRQPTVSQQLARLRMDGLVSTRRDGKVIYYRLASEDARVILGAIYDVFCGKDRK